MKEELLLKGDSGPPSEPRTTKDTAAKAGHTLKKCTPVDLDFLDNAPIRYEHVLELNASPAEVFEILEDGTSWTKWFTEITDVQWHEVSTAEGLVASKGVGTKRTVHLGGTIVEEYFLVWEPGSRFTFRFDATNSLLFAAAMEDYRLEEVPGSNGTRTKFTYIVCMQTPGWISCIFRTFLYGKLNRMFKTASLSLARFIDEKKPNSRDT